MTLLSDRDETAAVSQLPASVGTPRPEYPRPDSDRSERWLSLNGTWGFESIDGASAITVPFAWETVGSGVRRIWLEAATYRRLIAAPSTWAGSRIFLCFGAVCHRASIFVDGAKVGEHVGGYTSFDLDITDHLRLGTLAELTVEVEAPADKRAIAHGKQRSIPRDDYDGVSFTPGSGIWQSVWLEPRGRTYARAVTVRGDSCTAINITVELAGDHVAATAIRARALDGEEAVQLLTDASGRATGTLELATPHLWSPSDPHLYRVEVVTGDNTDRVVVTTGLRKIEIRGEELHLNGERLYIRGVLDQGYWPETGPTAPNDAALRRDLVIARELGFNLVRKHLKFEEPRWLHMADEMGMLVWAEPANPSRFSPQAAAAFEAQLAPMVERDGNHPSIVIWGLYNEEWGLDWDIPGSSQRAAAAVAAYDRLAALDRTRPIVENSGWAHVKTDLVDWHYYELDLRSWARNVAEMAAGAREDFPVRLAPDFTVEKSLYATSAHPRTGVPLLNSEFGEGFTSLERAWHVRWETQELRRHDRFAGYVYTELADVEHEVAGLVDTDRRTKDWGGLDPADTNAETVLIIDLVPERAGADLPVPTVPLTLGVRVSHHGSTDLTGHIHAAWTEAGRPFRTLVPTRATEPTLPDTVASQRITAQPFAVTPPASLEIPPPRGPARLMLWLTDENRSVRARAFIDAAEVEPPNSQPEALTP